MEQLLQFATKRIVELESLLLVDVVETFSSGDICRKIGHAFESKQDMW
ncbi:hypothetical protein ACP4QI_010120 [Leclercia sp. TB492]